MRFAILTHRYLGIAVSSLMVMWCLSGAVMMYVPYPVLSEVTRLAALPPLDWRGCSAEIDPEVLAPNDLITGLHIEMLGDRPIAHIDTVSRNETIDLKTGTSFDAATLEVAAAVAHRFAERAQISRDWKVSEMRQADQWTVSEEFSDDFPLYRFTFADAGRSVLYVSSSTGHAIQYTNASIRFWNWLGAVPHWLYFTELRRHADMWSRFIIAASLAGSFLTLTGLFVGVGQYGRRPAGRPSPYRGLMFWHHIPGLLFGAFALTWVTSGLLSMNPWGLLEGRGAGSERRVLQGMPPRWAEVRAALEQLGRPSALQGAVRVSGANLAGRLYIVADFPDGRRVRLTGDALPAPLSASELSIAVRALDRAPRDPPQLLREPDRYYFSHPNETVALPAYRVILDDASHTRLYLDAISGAILLKVDADTRGYRWLHDALHRLDFSPTLRRRPVWDFLMLFLLSGSALLACTGLYAAVRRLTPRRGDRS